MLLHYRHYQMFIRCGHAEITIYTHDMMMVDSLTKELHFSRLKFGFPNFMQIDLKKIVDIDWFLLNSPSYTNMHCSSLIGEKI